MEHGGKRDGVGRKRIGQTKTLTLTLPEALWSEIIKRCSGTGKSQSQVIRELVEKAI